MFFLCFVATASIFVCFCHAHLCAQPMLPAVRLSYHAISIPLVVVSVLLVICSNTWDTCANASVAQHALTHTMPTHFVCSLIIFLRKILFGAVAILLAILAQYIHESLSLVVSVAQAVCCAPVREPSTPCFTLYSALCSTLCYIVILVARAKFRCCLALLCSDVPSTTRALDVFTHALASRKRTRHQPLRFLACFFSAC